LAPRRESIAEAVQTDVTDDGPLLVDVGDALHAHGRDDSHDEGGVPAPIFAENGQELKKIKKVFFSLNGLGDRDRRMT
jgi:hypothetical protein